MPLSNLRCRNEASQWKAHLHNQVDDFANRYAEAAQEPAQLRGKLHAAEAALAAEREAHEATKRERDEESRWVSRHCADDAKTRAAIGDRFCLVPPDGGDVKTWEAAAEMRKALEKAEALAARMREALEPFAKRAEHLLPDDADGFCAWHPSVGSPITAGDLRLAARFAARLTPALAPGVIPARGSAPQRRGV